MAQFSRQNVLETWWTFWYLISLFLFEYLHILLAHYYYMFLNSKESTDFMNNRYWVDYIISDSETSHAHFWTDLTLRLFYHETTTTTKLHHKAHLILAFCFLKNKKTKNKQTNKQTSKQTKQQQQIVLFLTVILDGKLSVNLLQRIMIIIMITFISEICSGKVCFVLVQLYRNGL